MSSPGSAMRALATVLPPDSVGSPPRTSAMSVDVPPMSNAIRSRATPGPASATAAATPPAGPDSAVPAASRIASATDATPPCDRMTSSSPR